LRFHSIGVSNFRNIKFARISLSADRVFLSGANGQGKTNLLEAIGYVSSLRAFRARENATIIGPEAAHSEIAYKMDSESVGEVSVSLKIKKKGKELSLDGERVRRASQFVGKFPTVVLASGDLDLVRGSPGGRRRFLDAFLCGIDRAYYTALQRYQKCLQQRNLLLKQGARPELLEPFETQMHAPAAEIVAKRSKALGLIGSLAAARYSELSACAECVSVAYHPSSQIQSEEHHKELLERNRRRDDALQSTSKGPHRDDFGLQLDGRVAADFASDGQQRSIALALALAVIESWKQLQGVLPALLIDDVLGELDEGRRACFWASLDPCMQVIATGTRLPEEAKAGDWLVYRTDGGSFEPTD